MRVCFTTFISCHLFFTDEQSALPGDCSNPVASPSLLPRDVQTRVAMRSTGRKKEIYFFYFSFPEALGLLVCGLGVFLGWNS